MVHGQRHTWQSLVCIYILDRRIRRIIALAKANIFLFLEQRVTLWCLPGKSMTPCWCHRGKTTHFRESEEIAEQWAEEGKGDEDKAEGLFGAVGALSVNILCAGADNEGRTMPT